MEWAVPLMKGGSLEKRLLDENDHPQPLLTKRIVIWFLIIFLIVLFVIFSMIVFDILPTTFLETINAFQ